MFTLNPLPYDEAALEPYMSAKTISFHYGKHHRAYLDNLNKFITGTEWENKSLEEIIVKTAGQTDLSGIFNNGAQYYNHNFFWPGLLSEGDKTVPSPELIELLNQSFGSLDGFYEEFKKAALSLFGSGWVWLVQEGKSLKIIKTFNGDNPLTHNLKPLWTLDVWEHSYYLDYQNKRGDFVEAVLHHLLNWEFVSKNL